MIEIRKFEYKNVYCTVYDDYENSQYIGELQMHEGDIWTEPVPKDEGTPRDVVDLLKNTAESQFDND